VHDQRVGAGRDELLDAALGPLHHQVDVERAALLVDQIAQGLHDHRPDRDRRHEVAVHDIHVDDARARVHQLLDLLAEPREVGREDRGRHARVLQQGVRHAAAR